MTAQVIRPRWVAPPSSDVHPKLALIRHEGKLFCYAELLGRVPFEHVTRRIDETLPTPQEWWDDLAGRVPQLAACVAGQCRPRDFDVLDLYHIEAVGCA